MNTLYDFITHVKSVEYVMALGFIAGFLVFNELLKPQPFGTLLRSIREERMAGFATAMNTIKKVATAPFIGLAYIVTLPFALAYAIGTALAERLTPAVSFGWRPVEAYLAGRKKSKKIQKPE
jgi:hypothetical protein